MPRSKKVDPGLDSHRIDSQSVLPAIPDPGLTGLRYVSSNVPIPIPDDNPAGVTSNLIVTDAFFVGNVNLVIDSLTHTCVPDLHIELKSPSGTTAILVKAFTEAGILEGLGCPDDFTGAVLDDDAPGNLRNGTAPYQGRFNIEHTSVVAQPLSVFQGEGAQGQWSLFVSDLAGADIGTLVNWSVEFTQMASADVPIAIPDDNPTGVISILAVPSFEIDDVNLVFGSLPHTCVPDLHVELTSPAGTTAVLIRSFTENGIFGGLGCPDNFTGTVLDDDAAVNLRGGAAPFTGRFNYEHASIDTRPLKVFRDEDAGGIWELFVSDLAGGDTGTLVDWRLEFLFGEIFTDGFESGNP